MPNQLPNDRNPIVHDIRLLKLAELYEEAYERFVVQMATQVVEDGEIRDLLWKLVDPGDAHAERIAAQLERLNAAIGEEAKEDVLLAALKDVCEVERTAWDFYRLHSTSVKDPQVRALFDELAHEERRHYTIAREALALARRRAGLPVFGDEKAAAYRGRFFPPRADLQVTTEP